MTTETTCADRTIATTSNVVDALDASKKRITARIDPCNCGCAGRDPWHAASFKRVVRKVVEVDPTPAVTRWGVRSTIVARGTARLPWGADAVGLRAAKSSTGRWVTYGWALLLEEDMA